MRYAKPALATLWTLTVLVVTYAVNVTSLSSWLVVAAIALLPPFVVMKFWKGSTPTMSENIQNALK